MSERLLFNIEVSKAGSELPEIKAAVLAVKASGQHLANLIAALPAEHQQEMIHAIQQTAVAVASAMKTGMLVGAKAAMPPTVFQLVAPPGGLDVNLRTHPQHVAIERDEEGQVIGARTSS